MIVSAPGRDAAELVALGEALRALPEVEYAFLQVLGTPEHQVQFTSWLDETIGLDRRAAIANNNKAPSATTGAASASRTASTAGTPTTRT